MKMSNINQMENILKEYKISFKDQSLLLTALTHPTFVFENKKLELESNQRLEFLGDAVLGLVVAEYLYKAFPEEAEGDLTKMRAAIVCEASLAEAARSLQLGTFLRLGKGEDMTGGRNRNSNLADTFEALLGAIYFDSGIAEVYKFLQNNLLREINKKFLNCNDYKTTIQELAHKIYNGNIDYSLLSESGPDHKKRFEVGIFLNKKILASATANTKKEAEQQAAKKALESDFFKLKIDGD